MKDRNWKEIAQYQITNTFVHNEEQHREDMERLVKLYSSDVFEDFLDDPKCAECGKNAT